MQLRRRCLSSKNVGPAALELHFRVGLALDDVFNCKSSPQDDAGFPLAEKRKNPLRLGDPIVHLLQSLHRPCGMRGIAAPPVAILSPFLERPRAGILWEYIHNRAKSSDPRKGRVFQIKIHHIAYMEGQIRIQFSGVLDHARREVKAKNSCARLVQIAGHMAGSAAHVTYFPSISDLSREPVEQFSIERLVLKLVEDSARVFVRYPVIAFPDRLCALILQNGLFWIARQRLIAPGDLYESLNGILFRRKPRLI